MLILLQIMTALEATILKQ